MMSLGFSLFEADIKSPKNLWEINNFAESPYIKYKI